MRSTGRIDTTESTPFNGHNAHSNFTFLKENRLPSELLKIPILLRCRGNSYTYLSVGNYPNYQQM